MTIISNYLIYAGFPDCVVNFVLAGGLVLDKTMTALPNLSAISFTGSMPTFQWLRNAVHLLSA